MKDITGLFYKQYVWLILAALCISLFLYSQYSGTRLFSGTATEQWKPQGPGTQNNIHHK